MRLKPDLLRKLNALALARGMSRSGLVEQVLTTFAAKAKNPGPRPVGLSDEDVDFLD